VVCANADSGGVAKSTVTGSAQQSANPTHTHGPGTLSFFPLNIEDGADFASAPADIQAAITSLTGGASGATTAGAGANATVPTFFALAYIQKL
jgi:hypothetical protein